MFLDQNVWKWVKSNTYYRHGDMMWTDMNDNVEINVEEMVEKVMQVRSHMPFLASK